MYAVVMEFKLCGKHYVVPADEAVLLPVENVVVETLAEELAFALVDRLGPHLKRGERAILEHLGLPSATRPRQLLRAARRSRRRTSVP